MQTSDVGRRRAYARSNPHPAEPGHRTGPRRGPPAKVWAWGLHRLAVLIPIAGVASMALGRRGVASVLLAFVALTLCDSPQGGYWGRRVSEVVRQWAGIIVCISVAVAMIVSLTLVALSMLGGIGWLNVPMDIISAPATNVCIGIAIDSMIHLVFGVRRALRDGTKGWTAWIAARQEQWRGIVYSDVIIAAGFAIFVLSDFPPTQRFGVVVLAGCIVDILANLFVLPLLGGAEWRATVRREK